MAIGAAGRLWQKRDPSPKTCCLCWVWPPGPPSWSPGLGSQLLGLSKLLLQCHCYATRAVHWWEPAEVTGFCPCRAPKTRDHQALERHCRPEAGLKKQKAAQGLWAAPGKHSWAGLGKTLLELRGPGLAKRGLLHPQNPLRAAPMPSGCERVWGCSYCFSKTLTTQGTRGQSGRARGEREWPTGAQAEWRLANQSCHRSGANQRGSSER